MDFSIRFTIWTLFACVFALFAAAPDGRAQERPLRLLFLGDNGPHRPAERASLIAPVLERRGIAIDYADEASALNPQKLAQYDGLIIYANIERIAPEQEQALLDYVASGKGFVPLHCASYCFLNSDKYIELVGAQFQRHGAEVFSTVIAEPQHPIMQGFGGFASWDETYIHHRHHENERTVLEYRIQGPQARGRQREPWTWVRTHGKGRVFYTAWGHDERTWRHAGFHNLLERGIRWACGGDPAAAGDYVEADRFVVPEMTAKRDDVQPFEYVDVGAKIPNYPPSAQWGAQAEPLTKMQKPLPAEESLKHFVTPVGFEVRLFAAEPDLGGKPIAMNWDERGRLWVCETYDYPNELQPPGGGRDRIRICEDTDGDGRADKFTVFAEGLSIPTAIVCYRGGVIVQDSVETVFLKDTNGDGRADLRKTLISGWNVRDTHGGVSNFQWGLDNWIWAMQGYNNSVPDIDGQRQPGFRMGFFRFRLDDNDPPSVTQLEFIRSTDNNTWGLGISEEGIVFGSTANRNPSVYMPIPNRYYERVRGWAPQQLGTIADTHLFKPITNRVRQVDQHGGYTAGAGHALYTARAWPANWWNKTAFVCGPTGHLVGTFVLRRDGADFKSTSPCNLIASDDEWSAPILAEVGPDGHVWVVDWYNFIVQHNPTPQGFRTGRGNAYETDLRDKKHGRVYRVVYTGAESRNSAAEPLSTAEPERLVAALAHPTMRQRLHAQRLLVERGRPDVAPALVKLIQDASTDGIGLNVGAIHALWTLHGLGLLDGSHDEALAAAVAALEHPSAGVRRNAALTLPASKESVEAILAQGTLNDSDAQVRLATLLALSDMPSDARAGEALAELAVRRDVVSDGWLADALTSAAAAHSQAFLTSLAKSKAVAENRPVEKTLSITAIVCEHIARSRPASAEMNTLAASLENAAADLAEAALGGLAKGWPRDHRLELSQQAEDSLGELLGRLSPAGKGQLLRLASVWGSRGLQRHASQIVDALAETLGDSGSPIAERIQSARQLVELQSESDEVVAKLLSNVTPQAPPELAAGLIESLAASTAPGAGAQLVERMPQMTPAARRAAIRTLLARPETTSVFLRAVEQGKAQLDDLALDQKQALSAHPNRDIRRRAAQLLRAGGGLPDPDRQKVLDELLPLAQRKGDPHAGKEMFKKHCAKCHTHSGEGERIGPDLTGMSVHPKSELMVHVFDPSRSVEGNYRAYTVVTADGVVLSGMLAGESRTSIELIDAEAKRHTVLREDIEELVASSKSLMPEGFEKQMAPAEITDLMEFLTTRGKYTPLDLRKVATITSVRGMFFDESAQAERLVFPDWSPKTFQGVPFLLADPQEGRAANVILLYGPQGKNPPQMPRSVRLPVNQPAKAIHLLSGVSGWGFPLGERGSVSMIVRLRYEDDATEDHELKNGIHFADYIRRVDVPESELAFMLRGQQIRYLAIHPQRTEAIREVEFVKGPDQTAPVVMAATVEAP